MKEQHRFDQPLQQVDQEVEPADVGQLVRENGFRLIHRQAGGQRRGKHHHGLEDPHHDMPGLRLQGRLPFFPKLVP